MHLRLIFHIAFTQDFHKNIIEGCGNGIITKDVFPQMLKGTHLKVEKMTPEIHTFWHNIMQLIRPVFIE